MTVTTWIQTRSGKAFDLLRPLASAIELDDIAHSLSMLCRFVGHTPHFYSVAEHSVYVSRCVPKRFRRAALLHDAHEAYVGDLSSPLKRSIDAGVLVSGFHSIVDVIDLRVAERFELGDDMDDPRIHQADLAVLAAERDQLFPHQAREWPPMPPAADVLIQCLPPHEAKKRFLLEWAAIESESPSNIPHTLHSECP